MTKETNTNGWTREVACRASCARGKTCPAPWAKSGTVSCADSCTASCATSCTASRAAWRAASTHGRHHVRINSQNHAQQKLTEETLKHDAKALAHQNLKKPHLSRCNNTFIRFVAHPVGRYQEWICVFLCFLATGRLVFFEEANDCLHTSYSTVLFFSLHAEAPIFALLACLRV